MDILEDVPMLRQVCLALQGLQFTGHLLEVELYSSIEKTDIKQAGREDANGINGVI